MLTTKEVIEKYKISSQTVKRRIKDGILHPIKGKRNVNLFDEDELEKVFNNTKLTNTSSSNESIKEKLLNKPIKRKSVDKSSSLEKLKETLLNHYGYEPYTFIGGYEDYHKPIEVICNTCNNKINVSPGNMKNNIRLNRNPQCKYCGIKNGVLGHLKTEGEYKDDLINICEGNYELIGKYINTKTSTLHKCLICNYEFEVKPQNLLYSYKIKHSHYCPSCNNMVRDNRDYSERLAEINSNIIALEEYKGRKVKILHKCLVCNHEWKSDPNNRLSGSGCPKCANKISQSKNELEIIKLLEDNNLKVETKNRTILDGKEIDIFLPDYNLGIEFNGNYWHSEKYKGKKYHLEKTELAEKKGIRLIQIMDDEWTEKQDIILSKINHILKINDEVKKIYARKCTIKIIDSKTKNIFLNKNHIQGQDKSNIRLGLYYNEELVSVMTFSKPRICLGRKTNDTIYDYELSRFASNIDYIVIGAFSKLFKYFKDNYDWNNIITYADRRYSLGNVYTVNGWNHLYNTKANYWYVDKNLKVRYHRYNFRKQLLKDKFPNEYNESLTEFQIMDKTKYFRIWDCGNMVFKYTK